jgi:uncharacterized protein (TIGR03435 family)
MDVLFSGKAHIGVRIDKAYADFGAASLPELVSFAYRVKAFQVLGPDWMKDTRFDVLGKLPKGASTNSVPEMMQALLAERFHLRVHTDSKELSVYALVIGKGGSTLRPKSTNYQPTYGPYKDSSQLSPQTMEDYARVLCDAVDRPVVNQTGLQGEYMVPLLGALGAVMAHGIEVKNLQAGAGGRVLDPPPDSDLSMALIGGLKLESRKLPMKMIVVDHVDMTPTAN